MRLTSKIKPLLLKTLLKVNKEWRDKQSSSTVVEPTEQHIAVVAAIKNARNEWSTDSAMMVIKLLQAWNPQPKLQSAIDEGFKNSSTSQVVYDPLVVLVPLDNKGSSNYPVGTPFMVTSGMDRRGRRVDGSVGNDYSRVTLRQATDEEIKSFLDSCSPEFWKFIVIDDMFDSIIESII